MVIALRGKLSNTVWPAGQWKALEHLGLTALFKDTKVVLIIEGQVVLLHFPCTDFILLTLCPCYVAVFAVVEMWLHIYLSSHSHTSTHSLLMQVPGPWFIIAIWEVPNLYFKIWLCKQKQNPGQVHVYLQISSCSCNIKKGLGFLPLLFREVNSKSRCHTEEWFVKWTKFYNLQQNNVKLLKSGTVSIYSLSLQSSRLLIDPTLFKNAGLAVGDLIGMPTPNSGCVGMQDCQRKPSLIGQMWPKNQEGGRQQLTQGQGGLHFCYF